MILISEKHFGQDLVVAATSFSHSTFLDSFNLLIALINKNKWHDSQNFLRNLGYINIESKLYPKFRHELLNEKNNADIYLDIVSFIEE